MKTPEQLLEALLECLFVTPHGLPVISAPKELVIAMDEAQAWIDLQDENFVSAEPT